VLEDVNLRPVVIALGKTRFDEKLHVAKSTVRDNSIPDGTIASVIRNGFEKIGVGTIQMPEVIVNRL
jgi:molecular chaperone GrpE (heat shock protein)